MMSKITCQVSGDMFKNSCCIKVSYHYRESRTGRVSVLNITWGRALTVNPKLAIDLHLLRAMVSNFCFRSLVVFALLLSDLTDGRWLIADYWLLITDCWWLIIDCWLLITDDWWLMIDCWWLMTDDWWLIIDYSHIIYFQRCSSSYASFWLLMIDYWLLMIDDWLLIADYWWLMTDYWLFAHRLY